MGRRRETIMDAAAHGAAGIIFIAALWLAGGAAYFAPTIVGFVCKARNLAVVVAINFVFGWTLIGWVVALVFALWKDQQQPQPWAPPQMPPPYPYPYQPQQNWPTQPPMWHTDAVTPPYGNHIRWSMQCHDLVSTLVVLQRISLPYISSLDGLRVNLAVMPYATIPVYSPDQLNTMSDREYKTYESRLRRAVHRQGYILRRSRRRDTRAYDYGSYMIIDPDNNGCVCGPNVDLEDVARWVNDDDE